MAVPNVIEIESWSDLCNRLYDDAWKPELGRFRSNYAFRGLSDASYRLESSFLRTCGRNPQLEYHLLRNFRKYAHGPRVGELQSDWRTMAIGAHYSLPTRLLDWTYSPFVAVHFATANHAQFDHDGVVWQVDFVQTNRLLSEKLRRELDEEGANTFTLEMLEQAMPRLRDFADPDGRQQVLFFEPPSQDARIVNQYALFSMSSNPVEPMDAWLEAHPELWRKLVIPARLKWEVRDKLDQANITERVLFPGLDGLTAWLRRHYSPKWLYYPENQDPTNENGPQG